MGPFKFFQKKGLMLPNRTLTGHKAAVTSLTVDDKYIYSGSQDKTIRIWSKEGALIREINCFQGVYSLRVEGELIYCSPGSGGKEPSGHQVQVWKRDGELLHRLEVRPSAYSALALDEERIFFGTRSEFKVWEKASGKLVKEVKGAANIHSLEVDDSYLYWGAYGNSPHYNQIHILGKKELLRVKVLDTDTQPDSILSQGNFVYVGGATSIQIVDKRGWFSAAKLRIPSLPSLRVERRGNIVLDEFFIYSVHGIPEIRVWDKTQHIGVKINPLENIPLCLSVDKNLLYAGLDNGKIALWELTKVIR